MTWRSLLPASSALSILRELLNRRGASFQQRVLTEAFYHYAQLKIAGEPLPDLGDELHRVVAEIAAAIQHGTIRSATDLTLNLDQSDERQLLQHIIKPFNFLKHANKDPADLLLEEEVKPVEATIYAISAFALLFPQDALPDDVREFISPHLEEL